MRLLSFGLLVFLMSGCAGLQAGKAKVSILADLDTGSVERTLIVESIAADADGILYIPDRVTGNIVRLYSKSSKPVVVRNIESRTLNGKKVGPMPGGIFFDACGNLCAAVAPFGEVVRIKRDDLNPNKPGTAQTFATGAAGANGIAFDRQASCIYRAAQAASSTALARKAG